MTGGEKMSWALGEKVDGRHSTGRKRSREAGDKRVNMHGKYIN